MSPHGVSQILNNTQGYAESIEADNNVNNLSQTEILQNL